MKLIKKFKVAIGISVFITACSFGIAPKQAVTFSESIVWERGEGGIPERFVYGLAVANDSTILAFAEGRISTTDDGPHHIVLKKSKDMGATWSKEQKVITSSNRECYANPTPIVDKVTGDIFLFYGRNYANDYSDLFYVVSKDNGDTWSASSKVTDLFANDPMKRPFHLPGPGHGIQLSNGRLVVQVWHRFPVNLPVKDRQYGVSVIYSDDHGKTWNEGGYIPTRTEFPVNESRLVEMGGELVMNGRLASTGTYTRIQSNSKDGGLTWSAPYPATLPSFSSVDAGVTVSRERNKKEYLLITRPIDPRSRKDLVVSVSEDGGKTWPISKMIYEGPANYSDIIVLPDQSLFVLYGRGTPRYAAAARFSMDWIKAK